MFGVKTHRSINPSATFISDQIHFGHMSKWRIWPLPWMESASVNIWLCVSSGSITVDKIWWGSRVSFLATVNVAYLWKGESFLWSSCIAEILLKWPTSRSRPPGRSGAVVRPARPLSLWVCLVKMFKKLSSSAGTAAACPLSALVPIQSPGSRSACPSDQQLVRLSGPLFYLQITEPLGREGGDEEEGRKCCVKGTLHTVQLALVITNRTSRVYTDLQSPQPLLFFSVLFVSSETAG